VAVGPLADGQQAARPATAPKVGAELWQRRDGCRFGQPPDAVNRFMHRV